MSRFAVWKWGRQDEKDGQEGVGQGEEAGAARARGGA
ncbi:hypothetical protein [Methylacidimicrobium sp. B4]